MTASIGLGLGLFGVLSIIRLRSTELSQHEVAYYFSALALGLLGGLGGGSVVISVALMALIVAAAAIGDHPRLLGGYRQQLMTLDRAIPDEAEVVTYLEDLLGAKVYRATVQRVDLVRDCTLVDVRYRVNPGTDRTRRSTTAGKAADRSTPTGTEPAGSLAPVRAASGVAAAQQHAVPATAPIRVPGGDIAISRSNGHQSAAQFEPDRVEAVAR